MDSVHGHSSASDSLKLPPLSLSQQKNKQDDKHTVTSESSPKRATRLPPVCTSLSRPTESSVGNDRKSTNLESLVLSNSHIKFNDPQVNTFESSSLQVKNRGESPAALLRFKTQANKVKNNIMWKKIFQKAEDNLKMTFKQEKDGSEEKSEAHKEEGCVDEEAKECGDKREESGIREAFIRFDVDAFKPDIQCWEGLSPHAKDILTKPSWLRTEDELKYLHRFSVWLKCLNRYPIYLRKELTRVLYYQAFDDARVMIRQGDFGFNFYFILSGSVLVETEEMNKKSERKKNVVCGELSAGAAFGEHALLHDERRIVTIVCKEFSEFLRVDKDDFDEVLKRIHEKKWEDKIEYFERHPLFAKWTPVNLQYAVEFSQIVEYLPDTVILKDVATPSKNIFFIMKGTCKVVQKVYFWERSAACCPKLSQKTFKLPPLSIGIRNQNETDTPTSFLRQVKTWWVLRTLRPGDYFGVGEGDKGVHVISHEKVKVLVVNKLVFNKYGGSKYLKRMKADAEMLYPSRETALESFSETRKWKEYKKRLIKEAQIKRRRPTAVLQYGPNQ